jgi:heme exporter protein C
LLAVKAMRNTWWKILAVICICYGIIGGFLMPAPDDIGILAKTIRNLHFHVPMWFTMIILLVVSYIYGIKFLHTGDMRLDSMSSSFVKVSMLFGLIGLATGSFWARFTWGTWWIEDAKLNGAAIGLLMYAAYYILRGSIEDENQRGKFSAVYNLFAFPILIVLIIIYPRMAETSLHPASGDTIGFSTLDLDNDLRKVFYLAGLGWILLGVWIATLKYRLTEIKRKDEEI